MILQLLRSNVLFLWRHENIVHTVLYIFPKVLTRRICLTIKSFFSWWLVPILSWPWCVIQGYQFNITSASIFSKRSTDLLWVSLLDNLSSTFSWFKQLPRFVYRDDLHRRSIQINPLHPNIGINILHTVLYIFPECLIRRICLTIKSFFSWWLFPLFSWPWCVIQGWYREEKLDANHSKGLKG